MRIIAVDDEKRILGLVTQEIQKAAPDCSLAGFTSALKALDYAQENTVDAAFLDINMGEMSGLELAASLKAINAKTGVIFVTGYGQYIDDAFKMHCSGYIMKPVRAENVAIELARLRHNPPDDSKLPDSIGTFTIDQNLHRVYKDGRDTLLKPMEYRLFVALAANADKFLDPKELQAKATGAAEGNHLPTLYSHMSALRKKLALDESGAGIDIEHKRNKGYRLVVKSFT